MGAVCQRACGGFAIHIGGKRSDILICAERAGHRESEVVLQISLCEHNAQISRRVIPALLRPLRIRTCPTTRRIMGTSTGTRDILITHRCWYRAGPLERIRLLANPLFLMRRVSTGTAKPSTFLKTPVMFQLLLARFSSLAAPHLFEGMPESFFEAYHDHIPKTEPVEQYELRLDLYLLFHHLNHTVLFGVSAFPLM